MKFLVISDLHGNLDVLDKMEGIFKEADAVLFAGDFAKFGESATGLPDARLDICGHRQLRRAVIP